MIVTDLTEFDVFFFRCATLVVNLPNRKRSSRIVGNEIINFTWLNDSWPSSFQYFTVPKCVGSITWPEEASVVRWRKWIWSNFWLNLEKNVEHVTVRLKLEKQLVASDWSRWEWEVGRLIYNCLSIKRNFGGRNCPKKTFCGWRSWHCVLFQCSLFLGGRVTARLFILPGPKYCPACARFLFHKIEKLRFHAVECFLLRLLLGPL